MTTRDTNKKTTTDENTRDTVNRENLKNQKIFKVSASNSSYTRGLEDYKARYISSNEKT